MEISAITTTMLVLAAVAAGGCATSGDVVNARKPERPALRIGMEAAEVRRWWGEPAEIEPVKDPAQVIEIWRFPGAVTSRAQTVATSVDHVMAFNPTTESGLIATPVPVYSIVTHRTEEVQEVVMIDGRVARVRRYTRHLPPIMN